MNAAEVPVLRKKLRRKEMMTFFERLVPTVIAIEACGASHHWARLLQSLGHSVKLIPPQLVKPYVKRSKNDAADAEALCEAMSRPTMRFVPVKTAERQAALMLVRLRDRLISQSHAIGQRHPRLRRRVRPDSRQGNDALNHVRPKCSMMCTAGSAPTSGCPTKVNVTMPSADLSWSKWCGSMCRD